MPKIQSTIFRTGGDGKLAKFFMDNFDFTRDGKYLLQKRDPTQGTAIELEEFPQYTLKLKNNAAFWKHGLLMPDVSQQATALQKKGMKTGIPEQFLDIGYLCHLPDPDDNTIELLQHTFRANFAGPYPENPVTMGQITIRTSKKDETLDFYRKTLGMKLLSVQPVAKYGFTLYFVAYTKDIPPNPDDWSAVENREWLWKKPYCTIEIQHGEREIEPYKDLEENEKGWMGIRISATPIEASNVFGLEKSTVLRDPNNIPIYIDIVSK